MGGSQNIASQIILSNLDLTDKELRKILRENGDKRNWQKQQKEIESIRFEEETKKISLLNRSDEETRIYNELVKMLDGKIDPDLDDMNVTLLAQALATVNICNEVLHEKGLSFTSGNNYQQQRPEVAIKKQSVVEILKLSEKLGLSPKDRKNLESSKKDEDEDDDIAGKEL